MSKKILAIVRTSTIAQEIESQKKELSDFIISLGFKENEIEFIIAKGASARKMNETYLQLLTDIKSILEKKGIKSVALWHLNRLGRTEESLSSMKEYFERNKIQVYIKNPSLTLFNSDGSLNQGTSMSWSMFALMIKFETEELMQKFHRGKDYKKSLNSYVGGNLPFGYSVNEDKKYIYNEEEKKIVEYIYDRYLTGKYSHRLISKDLMELGYSYKGKPIKQQLVANILNNEHYIGSGIYPPIISKEIFDKCKEISKRNTSSIDKSKRYSFGAKLVKCPVCGSNLYADKDYYRCMIKHQRSITPKFELIERVLDIELRSLYTIMLFRNEEKRLESNKLKIADLRNRINNLKVNIATFQKKLDKLNLMYLDSLIDEKKYKDLYLEYNSKYNSLNDTIKDYQIRISKLEKENKLLNNGNTLAALNSANNNYSLLSRKQKYDYIHDLVERVEIGYIILRGLRYLCIRVKSSEFSTIYLKRTNELYRVMHYSNSEYLYKVEDNNEVNSIVFKFDKKELLEINAEIDNQYHLI